MKFKTRKVNFNGCQPDIAEKLKNNRHILCKVWDYEKSGSRNIWVTSFCGDLTYPYMTDNATLWKNAEPIPFNLIVKKASVIMKWLEDNGYVVNSEGYWYHTKEGAVNFYPNMWKTCGGEMSADKNYHEDWLEEE